MYDIRLVDDADMPEGLDWALVSDEDDWFIFYRSSALAGCPERGAQVLAESWSAYRALIAEHSAPPGLPLGLGMAS